MLCCILISIPEHQGILCGRGPLCCVPAACIEEMHVATGMNCVMILHYLHVSHQPFQISVSSLVPQASPHSQQRKQLSTGRTAIHGEHKFQSSLLITFSLMLTSALPFSTRVLTTSIFPYLAASVAAEQVRQTRHLPDQ